MLVTKPWGSSVPLYRDTTVQVERIAVAPGGYCSVHSHAAKVNIFHVLSARLYVRLFTSRGDRMGCAELHAGHSYVVPATVWHQFWSMTGCEALEVYLPAGLNAIVDAGDIERLPTLAAGGVEKTYAGMVEMWSRAFVQDQPAVAPEPAGQQLTLLANV